MPPTLLFGTGNLGVAFKDVSETTSLLSFLASKHITRLDTARRYPAPSPGLSETLLGLAKAPSPGFTIDTKIKLDPTAGVRGSLSRAKILASIDESLTALGTQKVHILYCHAPDPDTPIAETAAAFDEVYRAGKSEKLGLANYSVEQIEEWMRICHTHDYIRPSVYQGQYNALARSSESALFPLLRKHGMVFNAYSPLAAGFLTGRATKGDVKGTRFEPGHPFAVAAEAQYGSNEGMHDAVRHLLDVVERRGGMWVLLVRLR